MGKSMFILLVAAFALALEFLIVHCRHPIYEFVSTSPHVLALRVALIAVGGAMVAAACIAGFIARIKHGKCVPGGEGDHLALRCFAAAMFLVMVLCWSLYDVGLDASSFQIAAIAFLAMSGSVVAVRTRRWRWIIVYFILFFFFGALLPSI